MSTAGWTQSQRLHHLLPLAITRVPLWCLLNANRWVRAVQRHPVQKTHEGLQLEVPVGKVRPLFAIGKAAAVLQSPTIASRIVRFAVFWAGAFPALELLSLALNVLKQETHIALRFSQLQRECLDANLRSSRVQYN